MASASDLANLTRAVKNLENRVGNLVKVLAALNTNLVQLGQLIKEKEQQDASE